MMFGLTKGRKLCNAITRPGALHFAKNMQKEFILFCQFLLGKKLILGPEGGGGVY